MWIKYITSIFDALVSNQIYETALNGPDIIDDSKKIHIWSIRISLMRFIVMIIGIDNGFSKLKHPRKGKNEHSRIFWYQYPISDYMNSFFVHV